METGFTAHIIQDKLYSVLLLRGKSPDGAASYAYLMLGPRALERMGKAVRDGHMLRLENYGEVLESGPGEPSAEVKNRMEEEFGFNHQEFIVLR